MRVCWLSVSDQLGGSEAALVEMVRGLSRLEGDWRLHVILPGDGPLGRRLQEAGATCEVVGFPRMLARVGESSALRCGWKVTARLGLAARLALAALALPAYERRLRQAIDRFHPDILHSNGLKAHVIGARLCRPGTALVWHVHEYVSRRPLTRRLLRRYAGRCAAIIANTASVADDARLVFDDPPPVTIMHNTVDTDVFAPEGPVLDLDALAGLPPAGGVVRVGLIATFGRWKGHGVFIEAIRRATARCAVPLRAYIAGGPLYDTAGSQFSPAELREMIARAGLDACVGLVGFVDAAAAMRSLDIVVHASTEPEPFGLVIVEAMACARAVVTTAHGGAAEIVHPGDDALVAPPGDAGALADAIVRLAEDPALRRTLGARGRSAALEGFAAARLAAQLAALYRQLACVADRPPVVSR